VPGSSRVVELDAEELTVFVSMNIRLEILGQPVELPETDVVTFDGELKITRYELYCDPSPIKAVFTEKGPAHGCPCAGERSHRQELLGYRRATGSGV